MTLEQLRELLSHDEEKGLVRAQAIDAQVDRLLCWRISCSVPQLVAVSSTGTPGPPSTAVATASTTTSTSLLAPMSQTAAIAASTTTTSLLDRTSLQLTLECLTLLWTKPSTTERRKETRRQGVDLCSGLLLIWQTFPKDEKMVQPIRLILKSWTKLCKDDEVVRHALIRQSNLVTFLKVQLEHTISSATSLTLGACPPSGYLGLMKQLVFRASDGSQKEFLYEQWNEVVLRCILSGGNTISIRANRSVATAPGDSTKHESLEDATSAILWNWASWGPLARYMAQNPKIWDSLKELLLISQRTKQISVLQHVLSTIGTIVSCFTGSKQHEPLELQDVDDVENFDVSAVPDLLQRQTWILDSFVDVLQETNDTDSRRRCLRTIRCLSSSSWGRQYMERNATATKDKPLLALLVQILRRPESDTNAHIQICQTILSLAPCFSQDWIQPWIPHLQVAVMQKVQDDQQTDKALTIAALSVLGVLCLVEDNHAGTTKALGWNGEQSYSTPFYKQLKHLMSTRYKDDVDFSQATAEFLNHLARYDCGKTRHEEQQGAAVAAATSSATELVDSDVMVERADHQHQETIDEGKDGLAAAEVDESGISPSSPLPNYCFASNPHVVELLCLLLAPTSPDLERSQQVTIATLTLLVFEHEDPQNKKALADHEDLLTALVNLCLISTTGGPTKDQAKRVILALVPEQ